MNSIDKIVAALTPGSIFNRNNLVFRSVDTLASFTGMEVNEVLELLNGDLVQLVTCKPSKKGKGILVAMTDQIPVEGDPVAAEPPVPQVAILAENACQVEAEVGDAPVIEEEAVEDLPPDAPGQAPMVEWVVHLGGGIP